MLFVNTFLIWLSSKVKSLFTDQFYAILVTNSYFTSYIVYLTLKTIDYFTKLSIYIQNFTVINSCKLYCIPIHAIQLERSVKQKINV